MSSPVIARLAAALATLIAGAAGVVIVVRLIQHTPGPTSTQASTPAAAATTTSGSSGPNRPTTPKGFPAPPAGAVVFAREDRADTLALGLLPTSSGFLAQVSVLGDQGAGVRGLAVRLSARGVSKVAAACGPGCYRASFTGQGSPGPIGVNVRGKTASTSWTVAPTAQWPAPGAGSLMARATATWRGLRSLSYIDRLASAPGEEVTSLWKIVAPDRVSYTIENDGSGAVIIGAERWDRESAGKKWVESLQSPLSQPIPFWAAVSDAHLVGSGIFKGHPVWTVTFFDPVSLAWFEVAIEKSTMHTLDLHMTATAHFMHDTYGSFDRPLAIQPPG